MPTQYLRQFNRYIVGITGATTGRAAFVTCRMDARTVGRMDFYAEGTAVPDDYVWHTPVVSMPVLAFPVTRLSAVVDLLRHEEPLYLDLWDHLTRGELRTAAESVGEGES